MRNRAGQAREIGDRIFPYLMPDGVDAGHLDRAHVAKERALAARQLHLQFFMVQVNLVFQMVGCAPVSLRLEETRGKHLREDIVVVALDANLLRREMDGNAGVAARSRLREQRDVGLHIVALDFLEALKELGGPRQAADGVVRLVAPEAHDGLAEFVANGLFVLLVREAQVLFRCRRIEIVFEGLRSVLHALGIGVGAGRRSAEFVIHD